MAYSFLIFSILSSIEETSPRWSCVNTHCVYIFQGLVAIEIKLHLTVKLNLTIKMYIGKYSFGILKRVNGFHENRFDKNQQVQWISFVGGTLVLVFMW